MIALFGIPQIGTAGGSLGQRGFDFQDRVRFLCRLVGRVAGQSEHPGHVFDVLLANGFKAIEQVVIAIGQRQAALADTGDLLGRILLVLLHPETEQRGGTALGGQIA